MKSQEAKIQKKNTILGRCMGMHAYAYICIHKNQKHFWFLKVYTKQYTSTLVETLFENSCVRLRITNWKS